MCFIRDQFKIVVFLPCDKNIRLNFTFAFLSFSLFNFQDPGIKNGVFDSWQFPLSHFVRLLLAQNRANCYLSPTPLLSFLSDSFGLPLSTRLSPRSDWFFFCLPFLFFQKEK